MVKAMRRSRKEILLDLSRPRRVAGWTTIGLYIVVIALFFSSGVSSELGYPAAKTFDTMGTILNVLSILSFIIWFRESYGALVAANVRNLKWSPGWALGCWFIPFGNFVIPYLMAAEIWRESDPDADNLEPWQESRIHLFVPIWWFVYVTHVLIKMILRSAAGRSGFDATSTPAIIFSLAYLMLFLAYMGCNITFIYVVNSRLDRLLGLAPASKRAAAVPSHWYAGTSWRNWVLAATYVALFVVPMVAYRRIFRGSSHLVGPAYMTAVTLLMLWIGARRKWATGILALLVFPGAALSLLGSVKHPDFLIYLGVILAASIWAMGRRISMERKVRIARRRPYRYLSW